MSKIVNLRTRRKQAARHTARKSAQETTIRHGESSAAKTAREAETTRAVRQLDGHSRDKPE